MPDDARAWDVVELTEHALPDGERFWSGWLPAHLRVDAAGFEALWALHPEAYHRIRMFGRTVETPRFQQAYGADYHYTGRTNRALPVPPLLAPYLTWARAGVDARINGLLLNWYDGALGHYIGKHRDSTVDMIEGVPIVTVSLGAPRTFRLRPWKRTEPRLDFAAEDGGVFLLPWATNLTWTHEVPPRRAADVGGLFGAQDRRISITLRAFSSELP